MSNVRPHRAFIMANDDRSVDLLGAKPLAEAVSTAVKATIDGAGAFLGRICLPAAEEFGLLLRDQVGAWRQRNALAILAKAEAKLQKLPPAQSRTTHPRLVDLVLRDGSWSDEDQMQERWAGLLATGCTERGYNDENLILARYLAQITPAQARLIDCAVRHAHSSEARPGYQSLGKVYLTADKLHGAIGPHTHRELIIMLDHLAGLGLLAFPTRAREDGVAELALTAMAEQLFVRCQGFDGEPDSYFEGRSE
jgi:hypothetical protein